MSDSGARPYDELLELYLDDQLSAQERRELEGRIATDRQATELVACQRELDQRLRQVFRLRSVTPADVESWLTSAGVGVTGSARATWVDRRRWLGIAAASLLVLGTAWSLRGWIGGGRVEPYFQPQALTAIYTESVREGFQPYYFCQDTARFAATFAKRQRVPLELVAMPDDRRMIGLSYSGGFTRDTTAILCEAQSRPVIVFVDRRDVDRPEVTQPDPASGLFVHRRELGDLVLYEVGPSDNPLILDYLRIP